MSSLAYRIRSAPAALNAGSFFSNQTSHFSRYASERRSRLFMIEYRPVALTNFCALNGAVKPTAGPDGFVAVLPRRVCDPASFVVNDADASTLRRYVAREHWVSSGGQGVKMSWLDKNFTRPSTFVRMVTTF